MISQLAYLVLKKRRRAGFVGYYVLSVSPSPNLFDLLDRD